MRALARLAYAASCAALAIAPAGARASIPGNLEGRARSGLLHVCTDSEPGRPDYQVCSVQEGGDPEAVYTGVECGSPTPCEIDFIPKLRLKGRLLLIEDDAAFDDFGGSRRESGLVLELKIGKKKQTLVELFDDSQLGNWNVFFEDFLVDAAQGVDFTDDTLSAYQFANDNLLELGLQIRELAQVAYPNLDLSQAIPVLTSIEREKGAPLDGSGTQLGSGARFKVTLAFARLRV